MANNPDSVNYRKEDIKVTLEELEKNGNLRRSIDMIDTLLQGGDAGTFTKVNNLAYFTRDSLDARYNYRFRLRNLKTGYECTAITPLVNVTVPASRDTILLSRITRSSEIGLKVDVTKYATLSPTWTTLANGRDYQITLRFHYKEYVSGNDTVYKFIDWKQPVISAGDANGGDQAQQDIKCEDFYKFLQAQKEGVFADNSVNRKPGYLEIFMTIGGDELSTYIKVSKPSSTVIYQERPYYSNISNGLGLLSCRYETSSFIKKLNTTSVRELANGPYTSGLNFRE
jgi:hypothetical protein